MNPKAIGKRTRITILALGIGAASLGTAGDAAACRIRMESTRPRQQSALELVAKAEQTLRGGSPDVALTYANRALGDRKARKPETDRAWKVVAVVRFGRGEKQAALDAFAKTGGKGEEALAKLAAAMTRADETAPAQETVVTAEARHS